MKKVVFRFDIDTHKCIRDGVPNLLSLSREYDVPFTFFLNPGQAISIKSSIMNLWKQKEITDHSIKMLSARYKLGTWDYLIAAIFNPQITNYTKQIKELAASNCEMGIHGGKNHDLWHKNAHLWSEKKLEQEVDWAITQIKKIVPDYVLEGFASPGWNNPKFLDRILKEKGFLYYADYRCENKGNVFKNTTMLPCIGVNLLGEPGGVAYFENRRARKWSTDDIVQDVMQYIDDHEITIIYDHPYFAGVKELEVLAILIERINKTRDIEIVALNSLFSRGKIELI